MTDEFDCPACGERSVPSDFDADDDVRHVAGSVDIQCPQCDAWTVQPLTGTRPYRRGEER